MWGFDYRDVEDFEFNEEEYDLFPDWKCDKCKSYTVVLDGIYNDLGHHNFDVKCLTCGWTSAGHNC